MMIGSISWTEQDGLSDLINLNVNKGILDLTRFLQWFQLIVLNRYMFLYVIYFIYL